VRYGDLSQLPNIGKVVEEQLNKVGIFTKEDLLAVEGAIQGKGTNK